MTTASLVAYPERPLLNGAVNRVPEVTPGFWLIKLTAVTMGETAADFLAVNLGLGLGATTVLMSAILVATMLWQFRQRAYVPMVYWLNVVLISVVGTLITDNMAAHLMRLKKVQKFIVGCDRIAANGDFANKIGTYGLAVLAHHHRIPFYVAGPYTTMDWACFDGDRIPIEQRSASEVSGVEGVFGRVEWATPDSPAYNPAFDVTPAKLVSRWILDCGVFTGNDFQADRVRQLMPQQSTLQI